MVRIPPDMPYDMPIRAAEVSTDSSDASLQSWNEVNSPNEVMIDPEDYTVSDPLNEKDDVAIITMDQNGDPMDTEDDILLATDCELWRTSSWWPY